MILSRAEPSLGGMEKYYSTSGITGPTRKELYRGFSQVSLFG